MFNNSGLDFGERCELSLIQSLKMQGNAKELLLLKLKPLECLGSRFSMAFTKYQFIKMSFYD